MMEPRLQQQLGRLESAVRRARLWRRLAWCWIAATVLCVALFVVHRVTGWDSRLVWTLPAAVGALAAAIVCLVEENRRRDFRGLATALEAEHPELHPLITTAIEQQPDRETGEFHFLQRRLINAVITHRHQRLWSEDTQRKLFSAVFFQTGALVVFIAVLFVSRVIAGGGRHSSAVANHQLSSNEVEVTPGDTQVERGTGLVISARFGGKPPPDATLVLITASGRTKRLPLERHLADPVFGASLLEVDENALYRVEYESKKTRDFKITVFDYPALSKANAALEYPSYTGLTNRVIPDTLRVTAVEGTHLTYTLELNKPVAHARLVAKDGASLPLAVQTNAVAMLNAFRLTNSARYSLELVDADGRTNKLQSDFSIQVLTNRAPEVKIAFPRGDQRVSRLEELQLQASASDDFGVLKYGVGYGIAGEDPKFVELGGAVRANDKRQFTNMISMEKLGVDVDQVVSYFAWADDYGPDGEVRRTFSDMYFAEVRPFDEIFRADQSGEGENQQNQRQGQQGGGNQNTRLAELQKEIVIATWKLQRDNYGPSAKK